MDNKIKSISSPSHNITSKKERSTKDTFAMKTSLSGQNVKQTNNDILLLVECDNPKGPLVLVEKSNHGTDEDTMVAVSFLPSFDLQHAPKEKLFLLDKSSKTDTEETSIFYEHNASNIVQRLIYSYQLMGEDVIYKDWMISKNCFFNVVRYGKFSTAVFPNGSEPFNRETMEKAIGVIEVGCRDMGANNLGAVLEHTLQQSPKNGLPRQLILFIRGKVANEDFILDLVRQHAHNTTVFCVGQGATVSKSLVRNIARAGGGISYSIASKEERIVVVNQLSKDAFLPELKELRISWQDSAGTALTGWDNFGDTETFASISPTYKGDRLLVYGKFPASQVPATITAESQDSSSKDVIQIPNDKTSQLSSHILHRLVAGKLMRDLEKQEFGSEDMKERIMELALKSQLVSKFTSFVGKKTFN